MEKTTVKKKFNYKRAFFIFLFLLMPSLQFLIFYVYINFDAFFMAFQTVKSKEVIWGFQNFTNFFEELTTSGGIMQEAFINTIITFLVILAMFPIGFLVSLFIYKKILGAKVFRIIFYLPSLISGTIIASLYIMLCNNTGAGSEHPSIGALSLLVQKLLNLDYAPALLAEERWANTFVIVNIIWLSFPGDLIIWGGTLSRIPDSLVESAKIDGVNWFQEMTKIIIPIIWPTFILKVLLMTTGIFGAGGNVFLLTNKGDYGTQTLANWMYLQIYNQGGYLRNSNVLNYLSAVGLILTACTAVIVIIVHYVMKIFDQEVTF